MNKKPQTFLTSKFTLKPYHGAFSGNLKRVFLRKMHFYFHPFQPKTTIFGLLRGHFWPKTWKIKCFQFIQSKISQFVTQMWLPKKLQFLVPGTPPDPPIPPLTPPGVRGSQKWPKCIPSSPIMIINAKKAISGGSKILTYFFTRNVPFVCFWQKKDVAKVVFGRYELYQISY